MQSERGFAKQRTYMFPHCRTMRSCRLQVECDKPVVERSSTTHVVKTIEDIVSIKQHGLNAFVTETLGRVRKKETMVRVWSFDEPKLCNQNLKKIVARD